MFEVSGRSIRISRGDTGLIAFDAEGTALSEKDLAVFTVRRQSGGIVMEKVIAPEDNRFTVPFTNEETEALREGDYVWDIRIVLGAQTNADGRVTGGREVITPLPPSPLKIMKVVGRV